MTGARGTPGTGTPEALAGLIGARICHDLVSPLGAIGNGLELLQIAGGQSGPEMALMSESIASATARLRMFRIAFGASQPEARIGRAEIAQILAGLAPAARCLVSWQVRGDLPRDEVRLAFLLLMCLETSLPYGGGLTFARAATGGTDRWTIRAEAGRRAFDSALWSLARGQGSTDGLAPRHVHFALVPSALAALGRRRLALAEGVEAVDITA